MTLAQIAAQQARLERRLNAQTVQLRQLRDLNHQLAQRCEALRLTVDFATTPSEPQPAYERAAAAQADARADREARRRIITAVPGRP